MSKSLIHNILLIAIIVFAAIIRSINIGKFGLYGDEKYSLMVVNGISWEGATQKEIFAKNDKGEPIKKYFTPKEFWSSLSFSDFDEAIIRTDNGNSSTFYGFLFVWKSIFGQTDGALRMMGVLFDCLTILLLFYFCKNILNLPIVGLISGFFAAIEPFLIAYSHQVRNYPVGIFLTLLSVYFLFLILKSESKKESKYWLYLGYGLSVVLGILCHFYVVLFIFCQFIFLLFRYLKNLQIVKRFIITYIVSFFFIGLWFTIGSGRKTIATFQEKDQIFRNMVKNQGDKGVELSFVTVANFENIKNKITTIFTDNFVLTNDILGKLNGKLNLLFCLFLSGIFILLLNFSKEEKKTNKNYDYVIIAVVISILFYFVFSINPLYYSYLSVVFLLVHLILRFHLQNPDWKFHFLSFVFITLFLPIIITVLAALRAGHTANIYQKYLSFGLPIAFILMALAIWLLYNFKSYLAYLFLFMLSIYMVKIAKIDWQVLNDNYIKYTIMTEPRKQNPHYLAANQLIKLYQPGDTIIYPNPGHTSFDAYDPQMKEDYVSVVDAQLTNIYLPQTATYIQRVEATEPNKIYLYQKKLNRKIMIFDFEGKKFRY
ncbi:MAG: glycosyltransferase family 39 protein [Bacteroidota bacterium]